MIKYVRILLVFSILLTAIPCAVFVKNGEKQTASSTPESRFSIPVTVLIMNKSDSSLSEIPLDEYLAGCVLAQMPCSFETEALKCQAILARTYVLYHLYHQKPLYENPQSYFSPAEAEEFYGENYQKALSRATTAVKETDGLVLTYKNAPIVTAFHPISPGFTESAKDIWGLDLSYLSSVESPHDADSPQGVQTVKISKTELFSRLCAFTQTDEEGEFSIEIKEKSPHGTVLSLKFFANATKKEITGADFAEIFGLNSCNFTINFQDDFATITCLGGGHLVGLSQYGAHRMALSGDVYEEILNHYFPGVSLSDGQ